MRERMCESVFVLYMRVFCDARECVLDSGVYGYCVNNCMCTRGSLCGCVNTLALRNTHTGPRFE